MLPKSSFRVGLKGIFEIQLGNQYGMMEKVESEIKNSKLVKGGYKFCQSKSHIRRECEKVKRIQVGNYGGAPSWCQRPTRK